MKKQLKYFSLLLIALFTFSCNSQSQKSVVGNKKIEPRRYDAGDVVTQGFLDKSGNMWFTTLKEGVFKYDGKTFTNFTLKDGLCSNMVNSVIEDNKGLLWFATAKGLCSYNGKTFVNYPLPQENAGSVSPETGLPSRVTEAVLSLIQDKKGEFWLGTISGGAYHFDGKTFTSYLKFKGRIQPNDSVYNNCIQSIVEDNSGNIWFTSQTHGGITRYDGKEFTNFSKKDGLPDDMIFSSFKDKKGDLWFGTLDEGLISLKNDSFTYFNENDGLCNNMISCFYEDKTGKLWIGSFRETSVCWFDGNKFEAAPFDKDQNLIELRFITEDKYENIWFGGRYGLLWRYDGKKLKDFTQLKRG
jgi:ligand-binding sensor domain-containing protein